MGGFIGDRDFIVFSGFASTYDNTTLKVFAIDTTDATAKWREMDPIPKIEGGLDGVGGLTHAATVILGDKAYLCGGSVGGLPHPTTDLCHVYAHSNPPGTQWSYLPKLPAKRAGGGMRYSKARNSLIYAGGSFLVNVTQRSSTTDFTDVWELDFDDVGAGWVRKISNFPYKGNHLGTASVFYQGAERHFFVGGQKGAFEPGGNIPDFFEYSADTDTWTRRASMLFERSHFSSSTTTYKNCGIIIAGGARNGSPTSQRLTDISYYSIEMDTWIKIGDLPDPRNTPICSIREGYYYCITGSVAQPWSYRRQIE